VSAGSSAGSSAGALAEAEALAKADLSGSITAHWPHVRNCAHVPQFVLIFSGSQSCGTMEKPS